MASFDLAPLYRNCLLRSNEPLESHERVTQELSDHNLDWKSGRVDTAMFQANTRQLSVFMLRYGAELEIRPKPFRHFTLMHFSLKGAAEFECDGGRLTVPEGRTCIIAPRSDLRMRWQQGSEQLILKIPHSLLHDGGQGWTQLPPSSLLPQAHQAQWSLLMQSLLQASGQQAGGTPARAAWLDHFERSVALFALAHHGGHTPPACPEPAREEGAGPRRLDAMEAYMRSHLAAPVSLSDLAAAAGVSARTLGTLCRKHYGLTPMDLLRSWRLDAVRARLRVDASASVTATAFEFGFSHLGRFSAYYRERFGELPSQTVSH
ncbi:MAG TPA: AraC family transcriptional regulator [Bordetella sp.]